MSAQECESSSRCSNRPCPKQFVQTLSTLCALTILASKIAGSKKGTLQSCHSSGEAETWTPDSQIEASMQLKSIPLKGAKQQSRMPPCCNLHSSSRRVMHTWRDSLRRRGEGGCRLLRQGDAEDAGQGRVVQDTRRLNFPFPVHDLASVHQLFLLVEIHG